MLLDDILDVQGPTATPRGEWSWKLEIPMGPENLLFSASLVCSESDLRAAVYQKESPSSWSDEVFSAHWGASMGAWAYQKGQHDGKPIGETDAIQAFARYLSALGVESTFQEPLAPSVGRRLGRP